MLEALTDAVNAGIQFLFGPLIPEPEDGVVSALQAPPVIIFFASLMAVLSYLEVMQTEGFLSSAPTSTA